MFDCFGMREAMLSSHQVHLPGAVVVNVASIPALAMLKITAWQDRKRTFPGRDAPDLLMYLRHYLDCGNLDRATTEHPDLFDAENPDYEENSARLLCRDLLALIDDTAVRRLLDILQPDIDDQGPLLLANQSGVPLQRAHRIIQAFANELLRKP